MDIITKAAGDALKILNSLRAQYKIILPTGEEFGDLVVKRVAPPRKHRNLRYPMGSRVTYVRPFIQNMQVGDVVEVPPGQFDPHEVLTTASAWACRNWGNGSAKSIVNKKTGRVEILRMS